MTLTIERVVQLDVEEDAVDVRLRHEHNTATTEMHCCTDGQRNWLACKNIIIRPRREPNTVQVLAELPYDLCVMRTVRNEDIISAAWRTCVFYDTQLSKLCIERL